MPDYFVIDLEVDRVDLVDEGANSNAFIQLFKRKENKPAMKYDEILASMDPAHAAVIKDVVEKAKSEVPANVQTELNEANEKVEKLQLAFDESETMKSRIKELEAAAASKKDEEVSFEEALKSMPESVQKMMTTMKMQKEAAERAAKELSDKAIHEEAVAKAAELKAIPVDEAKLVEVAKSASPEILEVLKAASKAIEESVPLEEVGKSKDKTAARATDAAKAWESIEKRAKQIETEQGVTREKAIGMVISESPDLYKEYLKGGAN